MIDHQKLAVELLDWYEREKRDLPWRQTRDPYNIWISEIMLQQTRVEPVKAYYERFMKAFPTVQSLAESELDRVLKLWEGLGYYSRARNIHKAAKVITEQYGGHFPEVYEQVLKLPGIGSYTAGAVLSIAYNKSYPAVDGNVLRVISRIFLVEKDIMEPKTKKEIEDIVRFMIPEGRAGDFTQSLMELGALICVPGMPKCLVCPVHEHCGAFQEKKQEELPIKSKKPKQKIVHRYIGIIRQGDRILMGRRPESGVLAGLWEFPGVEAKNRKEFQEAFCTKYGLLVQPKEHLLDAEHIFTHLHWKMKVYGCVATHALDLQEGELIWVGKEDLERITIPTAFKKIVDYVFGE